LLVLLGGAVSSIASAGGQKRSQSPFDALPLLQPGQLSGHLVYLTRKDCQARSFDLSTLSDTAVSQGTLCPDSVGSVLSPNGRLLAFRVTGQADAGKVAVVPTVGGRTLKIGPPLAGRRLSSGFQNLPLFSPDSRRVAFCSVASGRLVTLVADTRTGRTVARFWDTCEAAFTSRGLAVARGTRLLIQGRTAAIVRDGVFATGIGSAIATNPAGTLLAIVVRPTGNASRLELRLYRMTGREIGLFTATVSIPTSVYSLSPSGASAVVWWGCILQLVSLDVHTKTFRLHSGSSGEVVSFPAFSPDGKDAAMPRVLPFLPPGMSNEQPAPPPGLVILDGHSFKGLYRVPIDAASAVWLRP
jgi:hypothetical protein